MASDHEQWIAQALELARAKRYDEARELALRVVREDSSNPRALWIVASATSSLNERRNALRALLRVQPDNLHARQMLDAIEQELKTSQSPIRPLQTSDAPKQGRLSAALAALVDRRRNPLN